MNFEEILLGIVVHSRDGKSNAMQAIQEAKKGNLNAAKELIKQANNSLLEAHKVQTDLIQKEAGGEKSEVSLLMVHAQDHLMTSLTVIDLAEEFIELYENVNSIRESTNIGGYAL